MTPPPGPLMRELKARAQLLQPVVRVGRAGLTPALIECLNAELDRHTLVKVKLEAFKDEKKRLFAELTEAGGATVVLAVGHTITLYRPRAEPQGD